MKANTGFDYFLQNYLRFPCYYRSTLHGALLTAYDKIRDCIIQYAKETIVIGVTVAEVQSVFRMLKHDCPWMFFVEKISYQSYLITNKIAIVSPVYRMEHTEVDNYLSTLLASFSKIRLFNISGSGSQRTIVTSLHDYFCENVRYDNSLDPLSFECIGPLIYRKGVCEGISRAIKFCLDILNISALVVHGRVKEEQRLTQCINNIEGHTWNLIQLDGIYYHFDVTYDLTLQAYGIIRYDYYGLSDKEITVDHILPTLCTIPRCIEGLKYYNLHGCYLQKPSDYYNYLQSTLCNGLKDIVFQLPYTTDFQKVKDLVFRLTKNWIDESIAYPCSYQMIYNPYRCTFQLHFQ